MVFCQTVANYKPVTDIRFCSRNMFRFISLTSTLFIVILLKYQFNDYYWNINQFVVKSKIVTYVEPGERQIMIVSYFTSCRDQEKNSTIQLFAELRHRHPTFQFQPPKNRQAKRKSINRVDSTRPCFRLSRLRLIRWWCRIWWLPVMQRSILLFLQATNAFR